MSKLEHEPTLMMAVYGRGPARCQALHYAPEVHLTLNTTSGRTTTTHFTYKETGSRGAETGASGHTAGTEPSYCLWSLCSEPGLALSGPD